MHMSNISAWTESWGVGNGSIVVTRRRKLVNRLCECTVAYLKGRLTACDEHALSGVVNGSLHWGLY